MADKEYNPGFAWYKDFYTSIEHLPLEQQKEACYAIVKYGITGEIVDGVEMPIGRMVVGSHQRSIDNSVKRWLENEQKAQFKANNVVTQDQVIAQLILEGLNSSQIAKKISELFGKSIGDSAIRKSKPWIERKDVNFREKWVGENSQNSQGDIKNMRSQEQNFCENSQNFTPEFVNDSQNSQENFTPWEF